MAQFLERSTRTGGPISKRWNVKGWPTLYLIDAQGRIRFKNVRGEELDQAVRLLVEEARRGAAADGSGG